jgi:hypothetical protein
MILAVGKAASGELGGGGVTEAILGFIRRGIKDDEIYVNTSSYGSYRLREGIGLKGHNPCEIKIQ